MVEDYSKFKLKAKEIGSRIEELYETLRGYCEENDVNRVFGKKYQVTRYPVRRVRYDAEKLREILEPAGLWERVLKLDNSSVKELLVDKTTRSDLKRKIKEFEEVEKSYQLRFGRIKEED